MLHQLCIESSIFLFHCQLYRENAVQICNCSKARWETRRETSKKSMSLQSQKLQRESRVHICLTNNLTSFLVNSPLSISSSAALSPTPITLSLPPSHARSLLSRTLSTSPSLHLPACLPACRSVYLCVCVCVCVRACVRAFLSLSSLTFNIAFNVEKSAEGNERITAHGNVHR